MGTQQPSPRLIRVLLCGGGASFALMAFALCFAYGSSPGDLFDSSLKVSVWLALFIWYFLSVLARRLVVGSFDNNRLSRRLIMAVNLTRRSLLLAVVLLLGMVLVSAVVPLYLGPAMIRALFTLMVFSFLYNILIGAVVNSMLALQRAPVPDSI